MAQILRGKVVADKIKEDIVKKVDELRKENKYPTLAIVRLGSNPDDIFYEKSILRNCENLGVKARVVEEELDIKTDDLVKIIEELNEDDLVSGVLVFRPLPKHIDEDVIRKTLDPSKDVDGMNPENLGKLFEGDMSGFAPCTAQAAMEIIKYNNVELEGKNVVVINRSMVVGKPLAMMLLGENATVTICHSRTKDLPGLVRDADIVMTALGRAKMLNENYFTEDSIVIDIGMSLDDEGKLSGDADYEKVEDLVKMITPVPGGVGSITTSLLLRNVVEACK